MDHIQEKRASARDWTLRLGGGWCDILSRT